MMTEIITLLRKDQEATTEHLATIRQVLRQNKARPEIAELANEAIDNLMAMQKEIACSIQLYESILSRQRVSSRNSVSGESQNSPPA